MVSDLSKKAEGVVLVFTERAGVCVGAFERVCSAIM